MRFDTPATVNPIDQLKVVGQPIERIDGPRKVTGTATYAYEWHDSKLNTTYGFIVGAGIAKGRIVAMDLAAAKAAPGVVTIVTAENAGKLGKGDFLAATLLGGPAIQHYHQAIALVVADSFEQARAAAQLVRVEYAEEQGAFDLTVAKRTAGPVGSGSADSSIGDFDRAYGDADVSLDETYTTPDQAHAMMEPHATLALWEGNNLTLWTSQQMINWGIRDLTKILDMPEENLRLVSPFIGGGFGGKATVAADAILAALGARAAGRPVKVAQTRTLMFNNTTHRPATIQRIRLGARRDGKITAIGHESWSGNIAKGLPENAVMQTRLLYAGANRMTALRLGVLDLPEGSSMRAPGEASGMMALEIAMDEMAEKLGIDPIDFRVINDTQVDPENADRPFSRRQLTECLRTGAEKFGWANRKPRPGQHRDGRWLIGMGVASAIRGDGSRDSAARVRLDSEGVVTVETDMTDIGTGSYTIIGQTAAEMMGLPMSMVAVSLGDSRFPRGAGSAGQRGANSSTSGVYAACMKLREAVVEKLGLNVRDARFADGHVISGDRRIPLAEAARDGSIVAEDMIVFGKLGETYEQQTFGAQFAEVAIDPYTAEIRVRRMLAVCAAGRIINPRTARSQVIGAMTMGVGAALMEDLVVDKRRGFFVNHDLAGYEVPVHADIPNQDVIFLDETDEMSSPMKAKGVSELGLTGVGASIANAVYNATGVRVRQYPVTIDKLLQQLPEVD
ncbi:xanthine dehydrogenase molybdenum binding subunit apoprotein [Rhizobium sp. PP-F2F-G48]|uniref:aldehyde oxidoreductase molybdenum-binding subunit PaoC n=1 Tax=Rhizobium sp. PP-F2F-G48 TaxID=2135651 RepID=UPI00104960B6|nr:aldehyde oxidoreductase molybdenum-binding subunit PaoC [Rhizobium sp. PP-F2F-G48]TCM47211.1 xanthine dehydrogenase molybdenum binding subunit apoprotein [Rhizobium sp. PP-F2F-G48]